MSDTNESGFEYVEILNAINIQRSNTRYFIFALLCLCLILVGTIIYVAEKPPMVIRIDKLGNTDVVLNYKTESKLTTADDIKNFVNVFIKNYYGLRSDYVVPQLEKSVNMMTPAFRDVHMSAFKKNQTIGKLQAANVLMETQLTSEITYDVYGDQIEVKFSGNLNRSTLGEEQPTAKTVKPFNANLTLVKTERTPDHPYGLLVDAAQIRFDDKTKSVDDSMEGMLDE